MKRNLERKQAVNEAKRNILAAIDRNLRILGDVPVPGDYDGEGKTDVAVWRQSSGVWYILRSSDGGMLSPQWGAGALGDIPIKSRW